MASSKFLSDQFLDWGYESDIDELLLRAINEYESNSVASPNDDSAAITTTSYSAPDPTSTSNAPVSFIALRSVHQRQTCKLSKPDRQEDARRYDTINFNVGPETRTVKRRRPLVIDDSDSD